MQASGANPPKSGILRGILNKVLIGPILYFCWLRQVRILLKVQYSCRLQYKVYIYTILSMDLSIYTVKGQTLKSICFYLTEIN